MPIKIRKLENIYRSVKPLVKAVAQTNMIKPDFYELALKAALAKSFDFNSVRGESKIKCPFVYKPLGPAWTNFMSVPTDHYPATVDWLVREGEFAIGNCNRHYTA
jgi:hypothetical protein